MNVRNTLRLEPVFYGLILGMICYYFEWWTYQQYLEKLDSNTKITFIPYPFTLTFWNFAIPIMMIAIGIRLLRERLFRRSGTLFFAFLEGVLIGFICILFGLALFNLNHYLGYLYTGDYENNYFSGLPLYGFPLDIVILIPVINMIYRLLYRKISEFIEKHNDMV
jgi:hypothetical protein